MASDSLTFSTKIVALFSSIEKAEEFIQWSQLDTDGGATGVVGCEKSDLFWCDFIYWGYRSIL